MQKAVGRDGSNVAGRDADELFETLSAGGRRGPERVLDLMLRTGPYGDGFGADPDGLTLAKLEANPHGIDFGPLQPRLPDVLRTPTGKIELAPEPIVADVAERLVPSLDRRADGELVLVGRRDLRSNNSWMHNVEVLVKGKPRCTLHVHPDDALRLGLADGGRARVRSRVGEVEIPVEVTDGIMPGVVSIPHGWGHDVAGADLAVAARYAGVNTNLLADGSGRRSAVRERRPERHPGHRRGPGPGRHLTTATTVRGRPEAPSGAEPGRVAASRPPPDRPIYPAWRVSGGTAA